VRVVSSSNLSQCVILLQCVAVCCSLLQFVAACVLLRNYVKRILSVTYACCEQLLSVEVCCNVL